MKFQCFICCVIAFFALAWQPLCGAIPCQDKLYKQRALPVYYGEQDPILSNEEYDVFRLGSGGTATVFRFVAKNGSRTFIRRVYKKSFNGQTMMMDDMRGYTVLKIAIQKLGPCSQACWRVPEVIEANFKDNYLDLSDTRGSTLRKNTNYRNSALVTDRFKKLAMALRDLDPLELRQAFLSEAPNTPFNRLKVDHIEKTTLMAFSTENKVNPFIKLHINSENIIVTETGDLVIIDPY